MNPERDDPILDALLEVCRFGAALLIVTHDPDVGARCARQLVMRDGRIAPSTPAPPGTGHAIDEGEAPLPTSSPE